MALFNLFVALLVVLCSLAMGKICGETCRFRLCRRNSDRSLAPIGRRIILNAAPIPVICSDDPLLGILSGVNIGRPFIRVGSNFVTVRQWFMDKGLGDVGGKSITDASMRQLYRRFTREKGVSSSFNAAQYRELKDECIILPVVSFESIFLDPFRRTPRIRLNNPFVDCVSIRTLAPTLHVEWVWAFAGDNFDLEVVEPDGVTKINKLNPTSANGRLVNDIGRDGCDGRIQYARESIVYRDTAPSGTYTINVVNSGRCPPRPGKNPFALYSLRVFKDGQIIFNTFNRAIGRRFSQSWTFTL